MDATLRNRLTDRAATLLREKSTRDDGYLMEEAAAALATGGDQLVIPEPLVPPTGFPVTPEGLREAWDAVVPTHDGPMSVQERVLFTAVNTVYAGLTRNNDPQTANDQDRK